jgi:DMSO/TMAO reductase YedYZ molybdopterin-dependent catalytic subunit
MKHILLAAALMLIMLMLPFSACVRTSTTTPATSPATTEVEATRYLDLPLTPISQQRNNALAGTQYIDKATYILKVDGLVDHPLGLTYDQLAAYPQVSRLAILHCVEGWEFKAKWTGPTLNSILKDAGVQPAAKFLIFHTTDVPEGYTSLELSWVQFQDTIIAMKLNDVTMPQDRGFPFQVVAEGKYGYKWAKWVTRIEVTDDISFLGYWERYGYDNNGDITFGPF